MNLRQKLLLQQMLSQPRLADGGSVPKKTVKAYKLFRVDPKHPGKLFPLFVNADKPVALKKWIDAEVGPQTDTGKVKSKLGPLAYRPGWHSGDLPVATHIGGKSDPKLNKPDRRPSNHVWAEVSVPDDVDWQSEANKRGMNKQGKLVPVKAHITDQLPKGGHYRYKTNPNMTGNWLISGSMKVNRVLPDEEVQKINKRAGVSDLPRDEPVDIKKLGFANGGSVGPDVPDIGINVATDKAAGRRYADLIVDGRKKYESRDSHSLKPYVNKRVAIVRTGEGRAKAIGAVTIGEPMLVDADTFDAMRPHHLVPAGSQFDIQSGRKYLYPMINPKRFKQEIDVGHGIVSRRLMPGNEE